MYRTHDYPIDLAVRSQARARGGRSACSRGYETSRPGSD